MLLLLVVGNTNRATAAEIANPRRKAKRSCRIVDNADDRVVKSAASDMETTANIENEIAGARSSKGR
jgi:hypothetical protein